MVCTIPYMHPSTSQKDKWLYMMDDLHYIVLLQHFWAMSMARCIAASVDGSWASWERWTTCSVTCDGGTSARFRTCSNPTPSSLGKFCVGPSFDVTSCSQIPCPGKLFEILVKYLGPEEQLSIKYSNCRTRSIVRLSINEGDSFLISYKWYRCIFELST